MVPYKVSSFRILVPHRMLALAPQLTANAEAVSWCPGIGQTFFDGLWAGSGTITREFSVVVQRIINMGFNAVRVPFSFPVTLYLSSLVLLHGLGSWKCVLMFHSYRFMRLLDVSFKGGCDLHEVNCLGLSSQNI